MGVLGRVAIALDGHLAVMSAPLPTPFFVRGLIRIKVQTADHTSVLQLQPRDRFSQWVGRNRARLGGRALNTIGYKSTCRPRLGEVTIAHFIDFT